MQNKKSNKYFEAQNTQPSRASGNVKKRSSIKKGDYSTGLFSGGSDSNVSGNAPKIQKPQQPRLTSKPTLQPNFFQRQLKYRPAQNNFIPKQNVAYSGQGSKPQPQPQPQSNYGDDWQGDIDVSDSWFDNPLVDTDMYSEKPNIQPITLEYRHPKGYNPDKGFSFQTKI